MKFWNKTSKDPGGGGSKEETTASALSLSATNRKKKQGPRDSFATPQNVERDRWPNRTAFFLAAIGSAVGFGNIWRFPALVKDYGGGAFFVPYLLALFFIGLPLLVLEIALGQFHQTGNVGVFGRFHARFRGVGVSAVACGYILVTYYSMLLAWVTNAFFSSFSVEDPWGNATATGEDGVSHFQMNIIGMETLGDDLRPTRLVGENVGYSALVWLTVFLCLAFGLKVTGYLTYVTMGLPVVLLFVFLGKACTLPGASDGINAYIGEWDMSVLKDNPEVWSVAVAQIFFSLSITFGTMTAYGSHCPREETAFVNSTVIAISNSLFSFISGFAVFATLGYSAYIQDKAIDEIPYSGFSLVFGTWPIVFGTLPGGEHWVRLIFVMLFLLGIDSAFSILEAPITIFIDHERFQHSKKWIVTGGFCFAGYICSLLYATDAGLIFLDTVDFYINFLLLLVGFFETFGAGWVYGIEEQIATYGMGAILTYMFVNFGSVVLACCLWFGLESDDATWAGFVALAGSYTVGIIVTRYLIRRRRLSHPEVFEAIDGPIWWHFAFGNVMDLTNELRSTVGFMPTAWALLMKQFIPHILLILFINAARADNGEGDSLIGHYEGYVMWPFQVIGILCLVLVGCLTIVGIAVPSLYEAMDIPAREEKEKAQRKELESEGMQEQAVDEDGVVEASAVVIEDDGLDAKPKDVDAVAVEKGAGGDAADPTEATMTSVA